MLGKHATVEQHHSRSSWWQALVCFCTYIIAIGWQRGEGLRWSHFLSSALLNLSDYRTGSSHQASSVPTTVYYLSTSFQNDWMKNVMTQADESTKANTKGKPIKQCDTKCLWCGWTLLITESALKFIIRLKRARGMAQWVKAHVAKPEFHPWDAYSVGREPMPTSHGLHMYTHLHIPNKWM